MKIKFITFGLLAITPALVFAKIEENIKYGDNNAKVIVLQNFLYNRGYFSASSTGYFGNQTLQAVKEYQNSVGVTNTGYVGPLTRSSINSEMENVNSFSRKTNTIPATTTLLINNNNSTSTYQNVITSNNIATNKTVTTSLVVRGINLDIQIINKYLEDSKTGQITIKLLNNGIPTIETGTTAKEILVKVNSQSPNYFPDKYLYLTKSKEEIIANANGEALLSSYLYTTFDYKISTTTPAGKYNMTINVPSLNITKTLTIEILKDSSPTITVNGNTQNTTTPTSNNTNTVINTTQSNTTKENISIIKSPNSINQETYTNTKNVKIGSFIFQNINQTPYRLMNLDVTLNSQIVTNNLTNLLIKEGDTIIGSPIINPSDTNINRFTLSSTQSTGINMRQFDLYVDIGGRNGSLQPDMRAIYTTVDGTKEYAAKGTITNVILK